jgi:Nif-specific regulatory protein
MADDAAALRQIRRERDLYARLLSLGRNTELEPLLREAPALIVEVTGARQGYLELYDDDDAGAPRWWAAHGFGAAELDGVRAAMSSGIIAEAIATGRTVVTTSALADPRFKDRESVRVRKIEAVLCVPIGHDPPRGVLYLQGSQGARTFSDDDRQRAETLAEHLAPLVDRLLAERHRGRTDGPARELAEALRAVGVLGHSAALRELLEQVALAAPLDVTVLLTGDSGTGKSLLAQVIHRRSPRAAHPFVEINCGALPETLIESELFGAVPGAHSTATRRMEGKVAAANRGTLFLDEIGVLPLVAQTKLLQLLQSKQYYPLGATKAESADVRVVAATNTDLDQAVKAQQFREDLFYRLQVLPLRLPALAERREDIAELATEFCAAAWKRHRLARTTLSRNAVRALEAAEWPGNVRQLANAVEAAVIRAAGTGAGQVEASHVFPAAVARGTEGDDGEELTFQEATRRFQARLLRDALERHGWNVLETARHLDMARSHLYKLIGVFGLGRGKS